MNSRRLTLAHALALVLALLVSQLMLGVHTLDHLIQGEADQCPICCLAAAPALPSVAATPLQPGVTRLAEPEPRAGPEPRDPPPTRPDGARAPGLNPIRPPGRRKTPAVRINPDRNPFSCVIHCRRVC